MSLLLYTSRALNLVPLHTYCLTLDHNETSNHDMEYPVTTQRFLYISNIDRIAKQQTELGLPQSLPAGVETTDSLLNGERSRS